MNAPYRQGIPLRPARDAMREKAMSTLTRAVLTIGASKLNPNAVPTETFIRRRWGSDEADGIGMLLRAASAPAMTSTTGWAKELGQTTPAFLSALAGLSAGADLLGRSLLLSFDSANTISISNVTTPLADFVAQNAPIPVVTGASSVQASLAPCKFAVITVLTREVVEGGNAEALVRDALLQSTGPALDRRLFDSNAAVADLRPAGLLNGKVALTPSADADKGAAMVADLSALAASVAPLAGNGQIVFIAAAKQAAAITIGLARSLDYPLLASTSLTAGTVIAVALPALVSALGAAPQIDETRAATMHMDSAPQAIATGGTMAGPTTVMFQTDKVALRLRWPISWALRDANAISHIAAAAWP
jgi:hypothetical protein